ncbi:MAG: cupredoxin domain-containing protein [Patescibacteria group bacterium]
MSFKKALGIGIVASSALILSACYHNKTTNQTSTSGQQQSQSPLQATSEKEEGVVVEVTEDGFSPAQVTVQSGSNLTYKNTGSAKVQIASDPHPTHTANSEVTEGDFVIEIAPGASATVTLAKTGTWGIHSHLNPGTRAKVTVN